MDNDELPQGNEALDDNQRVERLEKAQRFDRLLLIAMGGVLLVIFASWLTYAAILLSRGETASKHSIAELQQQVASLEQQLAGLKQDLTKVASPVVSVQPAPNTDDPAVTRQVAKTLMGQERNFQQTLAALKLGMRDLAGMIPGSRSWLTHYHESLDVPLGESRERVKDLERWEQRLQPAEPEAEPEAETESETEPGSDTPPAIAD